MRKKSPKKVVVEDAEEVRRKRIGCDFMKFMKRKPKKKSKKPKKKSLKISKTNKYHDIMHHFDGKSLLYP